MTQINRSQYQAFSNKTANGTPTQYWVQRFIDKVTLTIYLTPGSLHRQLIILIFITQEEFKMLEMHIQMHLMFHIDLYLVWFLDWHFF